MKRNMKKIAWNTCIILAILLGIFTYSTKVEAYSENKTKAIATCNGYKYYLKDYSSGAGYNYLIKSNTKTGAQTILINNTSKGALDVDCKNSKYAIISSHWEDPEGSNPGWIVNLKTGKIKKVKKDFFPGSSTIKGKYFYFAVDVNNEGETIRVYKCKLDGTGLKLRKTIHFKSNQFVYFAYKATNHSVMIYYDNGHDEVTKKFRF